MQYINEPYTIIVINHDIDFTTRFKNPVKFIKFYLCFDDEVLLIE